MKTERLKNTPFADLLNGLLQSLAEKSYDKGTLDNYRRTLNIIKIYMIKKGVDIYTPAIGESYRKDYMAKHKIGIPSQKAIDTVIRRLNDYSCGLDYVVQQKHNIEPLSDNYEYLLNLYIDLCTQAGNKPATIVSKRSFCYRFLANLIADGCQDIQYLNPASVCKACLKIDNKDAWAVVRVFLKLLSSCNLTELDFSTLVPHNKRRIIIPVTYSEEEIFRFEASIERCSNIGKRDYAMLLLATRLGMRSGDIVKLSFNELDFENKKISFIQQKTENFIQLPMLPEVKNALLDYINNSRPKTWDNAIFLRHKAPYQRITTSIMRFETTKYFSLAGIDISGKKHGPHTFRSSLASSTVNDDVPYEAVRKILGHSHPNAIKAYARLDIEKLRECSIEVPKPSGYFKIFLDGGTNG